MNRSRVKFILNGMAGSSLADEGWGDVGDIRASPCDSTLFSPRLGSPHKVKTVTYEWER